MGGLFDEIDGEARKAAGMATAAAAQEDDAPGWGERALQAIIAVALSQPTVHVDDVLAIFSEQPAHFNAWGGVWVRAINDGVIARTGTVRPCKDAKKHKHNSPVYRSLICGGE